MRAMAQMLHWVQHDKTTLKHSARVSDGSGNPPTIPIDGDCSGQRGPLLSGARPHANH